MSGYSPPPCSLGRVPYPYLGTPLLSTTCSLSCSVKGGAVLSPEHLVLFRGIGEAEEQDFFRLGKLQGEKRVPLPQASRGACGQTGSRTLLAQAA